MRTRETATLMLVAVFIGGCRSARPVAAPIDPSPVRWATPGLTIHRTLDTDAALHGITAIELDRGAFDEARSVIEHAAEALPAGCFDRIPTRVSVLQSLRVGRKAVGAAIVGRDAVYLVVPSDGGTSGERELQRRFYVQLGRLAYRTHRLDFPTDLWLAANPPGFSYTGRDESDAAMAFGVVIGGTGGFRVEFGTNDPETDAAMYIAALLAGDPGLAEARRLSASVEAKAQLAGGFLRRVHPAFSDAWFVAREPYR